MKVSLCDSNCLTCEYPNFLNCTNCSEGNIKPDGSCGCLTGYSDPELGCRSCDSLC